jgi:hypothetical protein
MKSVVHQLRRKGVLSFCRLVLPLLALVVLGNAVCLGQQSRSYWTVQNTEPLPPPAPPYDGQAESMPGIEGCPPAPQDTALGALSADITLLDRNGQPVTGDRLPPNCASQVFTEVQVPPANMNCGTCEPSLCELLQLAWFCHTPLYFEESLLERHGMQSCYCQPLSSACHFYGSVLLLPAKMSHKCLCTCVSSAHPCD